jgi:hypothetical protein
MSLNLQRRQFIQGGGLSLGGLALSSLMNDASAVTGRAPKAKRIIYLFMHGGPSQLDLFDHKPGLRERHGQELPDSVRGDQRLTGMTSGQKSFPVTSSIFSFARHGQSGAWVSELLPHTAGIVDDLCIIPSMHTEAINHDPAITLFQTGHQQPGRPSFGAWASYGLGSESSNLPAFVVLLSRGSAARPADPLYARLWGSGFLPSNHQGVAFRSGGDPVLYLSNPPGIRFGNSPRPVGRDCRTERSQLLDNVIRKSGLASRSMRWRFACRRRCRIWLIFAMKRSRRWTCMGPNAGTPEPSRGIA